MSVHYIFLYLRIWHSSWTILEIMREFTTSETYLTSSKGANFLHTKPTLPSSCHTEWMWMDDVLLWKLFSLFYLVFFVIFIFRLFIQYALPPTYEMAYKQMACFILHAEQCFSLEKCVETEPFFAYFVTPPQLCNRHFKFTYLILYISQNVQRNQKFSIVQKGPAVGQ